MKDFEPQHTQDNKVIAAEQRQVKTERHIASLRAYPGHRVFQFNLATGEVTQAKIDSVTATFNGGTSKKVTQLPNCLYCTALNKRNAIKKLVPMYQRLVANGNIIRTEVTNGK